jgi:hypothetical protein
MSSTNLTGRWVGQFFQQGRENPITADFAQVGENLSGTMRDGRPDRECTVFEAISEAGLWPGADEQIEAGLREMVPDSPSGPIRYVSHLPPEAILEGQCIGRTVRFLKTYQGTSFGGYRVGDTLVGIKRDGHVVHYEGQLSTDGLEIEGRWWIDADPAFGTRRTEGGFCLRRSGGSPTSGDPQVAASKERGRPWWKFRSGPETGPSSPSPPGASLS